ncbi:MAG TPA: 30S ribosomal protein S12 methylthiotransferase RimO [Terriglobia bacterium]|nr:30S ribosomal protein S12 methylthiotransferase RimO [Terriglobia bacterium]
MPKVGMVSLGCPKNLVDSEVMLGMLAGHGYELTPRADQADVLIVNTCSFIEPAKRESIDAILEMAEYKKFGAAKRLVVAGCLVERYRQDILKEIPEVDFVIGTNELERVLEACALDGSGFARTTATPAEPYLYHEFTPRVLATPGYSAYLKIAEGCDHPCTFCVIPQMRGRFRSRRFESVVREAETLVGQGVRELTLIGQDTTSYGRDLGLADGLPTLLRALGKIDGLVWLRFLYCYPNQVTDSLIQAVAETRTACKYFDIPLQHASRMVLKAMRRGSSGKHLLAMLAKIRRSIPGVALRTSMIVGFPGETEDDFKALVDFVEAAEFDHLGVFLYSNEESSASFALPRQVRASTARRRQRQLLALQRKISRRKLREKVGQSLPVLVEGRSEETELLLRGRLESQAPEIDGRVLINDFAGAEPQPGEFRWAQITASSDYDLVARLEERRFAEAWPPRPVESAENVLRGLGAGQQTVSGGRLIQIQAAGAPYVQNRNVV